MIGLRTTLVILCVAAAAIAAVLSAQASSPTAVRTFNGVTILLDKADFDRLATARSWCMQKGFARETGYHFDDLQQLGDYGYDAKYKSISCIRGRGVQS
jgi:hypothetical protein